MTKIAIIAGAGPAGLTAAYELTTKTDIKPVIFEFDADYVGGIAKTINYKGNRMDIGGHRFFSKSDRVMDWWQHILPLEKNKQENIKITYQQKEKTLTTHDEQKREDPNTSNRVMLIRSRKSRILFEGKFYDYPISFNVNTIQNLGMIRIIKIGLSYLHARLFPRKKESSLEDFFINRFGKELYLTFFKDYTEKVWGVACRNISAEWGAQRVKGLSISKALKDAVKKMISKTRDIEQKNTETSLIQFFLYPKFGPGQMWEEVANMVRKHGGEIHMNQKVIRLKKEGDAIREVTVQNTKSGERKTLKGDYFFSTMPIKELIANMDDDVPDEVRHIAKNLQYRDFITVGLLLKKLSLTSSSNLITDNWIYIQEKHVKVGRLQIFNNWSPYLVKDQNTVWLGLEYFCNEGDELWNKKDGDFIDFSIKELEKIHIIHHEDVLDSTIVRVPKTYPSYFGSYKDIGKIRAFLDPITNLFLIGRNGMHRYNNQDHSMLTAMTAVENIINKRNDKSNIWNVNTEDEYHEEK